MPLWPRLIASFLLWWWHFALCWSQAVLFYCSDPGPWIGSSSNLLAAASLGAHKPSPTALGSHVAQTEKATSCRTERQSLAQPRLGLITFSFPNAFDGFKKDIRVQIEVCVFKLTSPNTSHATNNVRVFAVQILVAPNKTHFLQNTVFFSLETVRTVFLWKDFKVSSLCTLCVKV